MKCKNCNIGCGCDECDMCEEIAIFGLCEFCHKEENCAYCNAKLDLHNDNDLARTVMGDYFCNREHYNKWKENKECGLN